jgi:hypothetical protein
MMKEYDYWTSYGDFHFSRRQIRWLVDNEDYFMTGAWPPEPAGEYLTDRWDKHEKAWVEWITCGIALEERNGKRTIKHEASFCKAAEVYGEVMTRLKVTGKDGKILLAQLRAGYTCLDDEAENALRYVSGGKAKVSVYIDWLRQHQRRVQQSALIIHGAC